MLLQKRKRVRLGCGLALRHRPYPTVLRIPSHGGLVLRRPDSGSGAAPGGAAAVSSIETASSSAGAAPCMSREQGSEAGQGRVAQSILGDGSMPEAVAAAGSGADPGGAADVSSIEQASRPALRASSSSPTTTRAAPSTT